MKYEAIIFDLDGVELEFEEGALRAIAREANERKTGARGLRAIMENVVMDLMYEMPTDEYMTKCVITEGVVLGEEEPIVTYSEQPRKQRNTALRRRVRHSTDSIA